MIPVVFEILFNSDKGLIGMTSEFSAYPDEQEVLLQDGLKYEITEKVGK